MGKTLKRAGSGVARAARWAGIMVVDLVVALTFFIGALLIGAVVMWILTEDDDS